MQDIEISFLCECLDISHAAIQGGERFVETVTGMTKQLFRIFDSLLILAEEDLNFLSCN